MSQVQQQPFRVVTGAEDVPKMIHVEDAKVLEKNQNMFFEEIRKQINGYKRLEFIECSYLIFKWAYFLDA